MVKCVCEDVGTRCGIRQNVGFKCEAILKGDGKDVFTMLISSWITPRTLTPAKTHCHTCSPASHIYQQLSSIQLLYLLYCVVCNTLLLH